MKFGVFIACCGGLPLLLSATSGSLAQTATPAPPPYGIGDAVRETDEARRPPLPRPNAVPVLPRLAEPQFTLKDQSTMFVRSFKVEGENLVAEAAIATILAPYENRRLALVQIYEAADKITTLYRNQGYLVAKAYVPAQDGRRGVLRIKVIPGKYGAVTLKNESLVRDSFLQAVIDHALAGSALIQKDPIERAMLLISDLPGANMPRVAIGAGKQPETSDFVFGVPEARRLEGYLLADNFGSPYTGRNRLSGGLNFNSPFGIGDRLSAFGIVSENDNLVNGRIAYAFPIGYDGLRGEVGAFRTTYTLGGIYKDIDATGTADAITATLSYPLRRRQDDSIYISGNFTHKALDDKVLGISLSHRQMDLGTVGITGDTTGAVAGLPLATNAALSYSQGNVNFPDPAQLAANIAGVDTVGNFSKVSLSFIATLALNDRLSFIANARGQKSLSGNLDTSEQLTLTGYYGVRSYDEGLSGDSGYVVTPELRYALPDIKAYRHSVGVFTDVGAAWIENPAYTTTQKGYTQLNDVGLSYNATYEYSARRFLLLKAMVAHTYGSNDGAQSYDRGTKGLVQIGLTF